MKLFSSGVCKKPSLAMAEDLVGGSNNFYWLLDGATPPEGKGNHELTYRYVHALDRYFSELAKSAEDPQDLLFNAIKRVKMEFEQEGLTAHPPSSTVVIVQTLSSGLRYLVLGDSFLCVRIRGKTTTITDNRLSSVAVRERAIVNGLREQGISENSSEYVEARRTLVRTESECKNKPGGYWIAELNPDAAKEALTGTLPMPDFVFAATDGLERLVSLFEAYPNLEEPGEAISEKTDAYIFNQLRSLEENPKNFKRPISSKHDDASYFLLCR